MLAEYRVTRCRTPWRDRKFENVVSFTLKLNPLAAECSTWIPRGTRISQPSGEWYCRQPP
jgi:hypothetical protein